MVYTNYNIEANISTIKPLLSIYPNQVERSIHHEDYLTNYLNIDYSVMNLNHLTLEYKGELTSKKYPLSMQEKDIKEFLKIKFNYDILETHVTELDDEDGKFTVLTMELNIENPNYSKIIDDEYQASEELELYKKNIILRLV